MTDPPKRSRPQAKNGPTAAPAPAARGKQDGAPPTTPLATKPAPAPAPAAGPRQAGAAQGAREETMPTSTIRLKAGGAPHAAPAPAQAAPTPHFTAIGAPPTPTSPARAKAPPAPPSPPAPPAPASPPDPASAAQGAAAADAAPKPRAAIPPKEVRVAPRAPALAREAPAPAHPKAGVPPTAPAPARPAPAPTVHGKGAHAPPAVPGIAKAMPAPTPPAHRKEEDAAPDARSRRAQALALQKRRAQRDPNRPVTAMPGVQARHREVELTPIVPDRAWVRILYDEASHTYVYTVIEPQLEEDEAEILHFLRDTLVRTLDGRKGQASSWEEVLTKAARQAIQDHSIQADEVTVQRLEYYLVRDFLGYGPVDVLMRDPMIEDISCDGPRIPIYLFHRKFESIRTTVAFPDELDLDSFVIRLAQRAGKHISIADPLLDATLPDGSRLQATLSREVTTRGSSFTVRKFRADPLTPPDLVRLGTFSAEMAAYFWFAMEHGHSLLLAGGTASGKTTTLNAVSQFIPPAKKIVSIEDTREINLSHENWIAGVTRSGFGGEIVGGKQAGSIDMYKLLEAALRQRPEYLLVGEVRGPEALTLFQAMATGHAVYSTMHADAVQSAVYRLENPPINVPRMMLQTLDIVGIQAQVRIHDKLTRRIREVTEVVGFDPDTKELLTNMVFEWDNATDRHRFLGKSYILEQVAEAHNLGEADIEAEWRARVEVIDWMIQHQVRHYADVARVVSRYYRDRESVLRQVRGGAPPAAV